MKDVFYLFHNTIQTIMTIIVGFNNILKNKIEYFINKYTYTVCLFYPLIVSYLLFRSLNDYVNIYTAISISTIVFLFFVVIISIPSYYFIKGENLFDFKKIIEEIKKVKSKNKDYKDLNDNINKLELLFKSDGNKYFNVANYNFEIFTTSINNIIIENFNDKIYLNEEMTVKKFVPFIDQLKLITGFDYVDLCKIFKFYKKGEYIDLKYGTVKVTLSKLRKLTKENNSPIHL